MEEVKNFTSTGSGMWKGFNTILAAAGVATGATALGSKASDQKVREIIREETGMNHGHGYGYSNGFGGCHDNRFVTLKEMEQSQEIALLKADKYTDAKIIEAYKQSVADNKVLEAKIAELSEKNSVAHETIFKELVAQREAQLASNAKFDKDIALNAQAAFFQNKLNECRFYQTKKVVARDDICPAVMREYNSWTAPTGTAPEAAE